MTAKIFRNAFLVGLIVLVLCAVLFFALQYAQTKDEAVLALRQEASYVVSGVSVAGEEYLRSLDEENRVTWIAADGRVIYDSSLGDGAGNQRDTAEVAAALAEGEGYAIRTSDSSGESVLYYALRCEDGTVLRLSRPLSALQYSLKAVSPVLWVFVLVLIISGTLAFRVAKQILRPINSLDLDDPEATKTYKELAPLVSRIQEQNLTIREQIDELNRKQKEFAALTDSMSEGFVLTDKEGAVLSANASALHLMPACRVGEKLADFAGEDTLRAVDRALEGERQELTFSRDGRSWQLIANPVVSRGRVTGGVLLALDVTEREQRERLRREFSANVSHELKTPLTSISGFAELMMRQPMSPETVRDFSGDIYRESQRLIALVEDIIKLSKLDEGSAPFSREKVDLYALAGEVLDSLKPVADRSGVTLALTGESASVEGVRQLLDEALYNLCDNAVKYNRPGGSVTVDVEQSDTAVRLRVEDTGIGIPYEHQQRVFERFYRVDKSHSKEIGGTGLGLSIVKHAVQFHGGALSLESEPGKGTAVTVTVPKTDHTPSGSLHTME